MTEEALETDGRRLVRARNRERLLRSASELFAQNGYRGTTTRDIADAAGIAERTLFRHVSTKAELFREAVIAPVEEFVGSFTASWSGRPRGSRDAEIEIREFLANLLDVVEGERHLLLALLAGVSREAEEEDFPELRSKLAPLLIGLDEIFTVEAEIRGWQLDPVIGVRAIVGMVLAMSIHADWLFAADDEPDRDQLVEQLTRLVAWGVRARPS